VPEQLALDQAGGDRRAVEGDEGAVARPLQRWIARASRSLPVPVSPRISTGVSVPRPDARAPTGPAPPGCASARARRAPRPRRRGCARVLLLLVAQPREQQPLLGVLEREPEDLPVGLDLLDHRLRVHLAALRSRVMMPSERPAACSGTTMQACPGGRSSTPSKGSPSPWRWSSSVKARALRVSSASRRVGKSARARLCSRTLPASLPRAARTTRAVLEREDRGEVVGGEAGDPVEAAAQQVVEALLGARRSRGSGNAGRSGAARRIGGGHPDRPGPASPKCQ
jgi:hypothetical protein